MKGEPPLRVCHLGNDPHFSFFLNHTGRLQPAVCIHSCTCGAWHPLPPPVPFQLWHPAAVCPPGIHLCLSFPFLPLILVFPLPSTPLLAFLLPCLFSHTRLLSHLFLVVLLSHSPLSPCYFYLPPPIPRASCRAASLRAVLGALYSPGGSGKNAAHSSFPRPLSRFCSLAAHRRLPELLAGARRLVVRHAGGSQPLVFAAQPLARC